MELELWLEKGKPAAYGCVLKGTPHLSIFIFFNPFSSFSPLSRRERYRARSNMQMRVWKRTSQSVVYVWVREEVPTHAVHFARR